MPREDAHASLTKRERSLVALGCALRDSGYAFVTVTPATHARVLAARAARGRHPADSLRDVFGWSLPFTREILPKAMLDPLIEAGALEPCEPDEAYGEATFRSAVRFSTLAGEIFAHSAYPTTDANAVFFGPDTYRFCDAIERAAVPAGRVADVGCGAGAGGIVAGRRAERVVLLDINEAALSLARVNVALAGASAEARWSDVLSGADGLFDLIVCNPPYMRDARRRAYRDGGGAYGEQLSVRIAHEAVERLAPGGTLLLYTGAVVVDGHDVFLRSISPLLDDLREGGRPFGDVSTVAYRELDPDVFGDELGNPGYEAAERIAAVLLTVTRAR